MLLTRLCEVTTVCVTHTTDQIVVQFILHDRHHNPYPNAHIYVAELNKGEV